MKPDKIEREVVIAASPQRVWSVLTEPEHIGVWFGHGPASSVDLREGGSIVLDHGEHGTFPTRVVKVDPPNYLSYRWASAYPGRPATDENSTLVEFTLVPEGEQTRLRLCESGFATLEIPAERASTASYESHEQGWAGVLKAFVAEVAKVDGQAEAQPRSGA